MNFNKIIRQYIISVSYWEVDGMSAPRTLSLSVAQRESLMEMRDHHRKSYLRERAAALLKIAEGLPLSVVAQQGLLKRRTAETVRDWVTRYETQGLGGLEIRPGRGRRPAFSPSTRCGRECDG